MRRCRGSCSCSCRQRCPASIRGRGRPRRVVDLRHPRDEASVQLLGKGVEDVPCADAGLDVGDRDAHRPAHQRAEESRHRVAMHKHEWLPGTVPRQAPQCPARARTLPRHGRASRGCRNSCAGRVLRSRGRARCPAGPAPAARAAPESAEPAAPWSRSRSPASGFANAHEHRCELDQLARRSVDRANHDHTPELAQQRGRDPSTSRHRGRRRRPE